MPVARSGAAIVSPRSMRLRTVRMAPSMMALPDVLAVMSRPSRIGTPELISVDSVRQNRATATFLKIMPSSGRRSSDGVDAHAGPPVVA